MKNVSIQEQIIKLSQLPEDWDGEGAERINPYCAIKAIQLSNLLACTGDWKAVPTRNGGIQLEQHCDELEIEILIESSSMLGIHHE